MAFIEVNGVRGYIPFKPLMRKLQENRGFAVSTSKRVGVAPQTIRNWAKGIGIDRNMPYKRKNLLGNALSRSVRELDIMLEDYFKFVEDCSNIAPIVQFEDIFKKFKSEISNAPRLTLNDIELSKEQQECFAELVNTSVKLMTKFVVNSYSKENNNG